MCMRTWAWKPSPSTVAQSMINEILNIVRWPLASLDSCYVLWFPLAFLYFTRLNIKHNNSIPVDPDLF